MERLLLSTLAGGVGGVLASRSSVIYVGISRGGERIVWNRAVLGVLIPSAVIVSLRILLVRMIGLVSQVMVDGSPSGTTVTGGCRDIRMGFRGEAGFLSGGVSVPFFRRVGGNI